MCRKKFAVRKYSQKIQASKICENFKLALEVKLTEGGLEHCTSSTKTFKIYFLRGKIALLERTLEIACAQN